MTKNLQLEVDEILKKAAERGLQSNFFFVTTFKRYQVQMRILSDLEKAIKDHGMTVSKEYVKGRPNLVANPALNEYNRTATAANKTVSTLISIIKNFPAEEGSGSKLEDLMTMLASDE